MNVRVLYMYSIPYLYIYASMYVYLVPPYEMRIGTEYDSLSNP